MFSGNVPFESFALPSLQELSLRYNQLAGQIDMQTFRQLANLTDLDLSFNNFSGELELDTLLSDNRLNGTLPSWLFTSPSLKHLFLSGNMFSGNVPFESFALPSLQELSLR
ncbi:leucine-rich repeat-containing protein [Tanacetum coccineum]